MSANPGLTRGGLAPDIAEGNRCLLSVMGQRFMVDVVEVSEESLRVTFPGRDYPVAGMAVDLEFHDPDGFNSYHAQVMVGPDETSGGLVLTRPKEPRRAQHRDCCRVPTDLTVQVKDQVHVRRFDAELINLSAGGGLLSTRAQFDFSSTIEMTVSLPGEATRVILGSVVHVGEAEDNPLMGGGKTIYGVRFIGLDSAAAQSIRRYIRERLRELYSEE